MTPPKQPDLLHETPTPIDALLAEDLEALLNERYQPHLKTEEALNIKARIGHLAAWLLIRLGDHKAGHVFEFFVREAKNPDLEGSFGLLVDFADGVLAEFFAEDRDAWLPLDFTAQPFEGEIIFARHEFHRFDAEALAEELLKKSSEN
jgi:hypothetical protein